MTPPSIRRAPLPCALVFSLLMIAGARAQLIVTLEVSRDQYISHEAIPAKVVVSNRSGSDVILAGPGGGNWLTFEVLAQGTILSPLRTGFRQRPTVLKNGTSLVKELDLRNEYPMSDYGSYSVIASVYYPPLDSYFSSREQRIKVSPGNDLWKQGFGVARGGNLGVSFREYSLTGFRRTERTDLYMGLRDKKTHRVLATYSLGRMLAAVKPSATVDSQSRLHVLHMAAPRAYLHTVVDADGRLVSQEIYRDGENNRPTMTVNANGVVHVRGGILQDPEAEAAARIAGEIPTERLASELPEGLPQ